MLIIISVNLCEEEPPKDNLGVPVVLKVLAPYQYLYVFPAICFNINLTIPIFGDWDSIGLLGKLLILLSSLFLM